MEQRISMTTLAVPDVAQARQFFEGGLGWEVNAAPSPEVVFFQVIGGVFALYSRDALEKEIGRGVTRDTTGAITLAWNARSESEVDETFEKAVSAGAKPVKHPEKAFWGGYSSYVEVPGGHLLEIAHNPFWVIETDGAITLPPPQPD
ncbi:VOC family protein [Roseibium sp. MMSF_3544]|uniref:VOC family protein n=1 Tax=unclassified Roseibium TaxID=2629323 RepID=UPI00273F4A05|nr:VOC family protein [Roseibium sp. MMSF_3544]